MHSEREREVFFCREEPLQALSKCINAVNQGQIWANSKQLRSVLDAFASAAPLRLANGQGRVVLTKREIDVVKLVVDGLTNRAVAEKLGLTEHTVSNYLFRIYEKLGISSRVELVLYSLKRPYQVHGLSLALLPKSNITCRSFGGPITARTPSVESL